MDFLFKHEKYIIKFFVLDLRLARLERRPGTSQSSTRPRRVGGPNDLEGMDGSDDSDRRDGLNDLD